MLQPTAAVTGFIMTALYIWYWKNASLSFKSVVTIMIATIFFVGTASAGVWGDKLSFSLGVLVGLISTLILE